MAFLDYLLLALILGYAAWVVFRPKKKQSGCCGNCSRCSGCHK